ncbi:hypothetical protein [Scytonema sp. PCC 10023]|uniref:hypothetical protein n=1 Tax=Scytonema sp. PCC 10023 TaxID=1680591 RepID=UPI0039C7532C
MFSNPFVGTWTYRSFHNKPEEISDFNDIRLWQATLTLYEDGLNLLKGQIAAGEYTLNIYGAMTFEDGTPTIRLRAEGIKETATAGWVYNYSGILVPNWPDGDNQRPTIVGTVIRTLPHEPERLAGQTYSFIAVNQTVPSVPYQLPEKVLMHFADRLHRLHHAVWHGIRSSWNDLTQDERDAITALDWQIDGDRVALYTSREKTRPVITNGSGEDFLFFHRQMVTQYQKLMAESGAEPIQWVEIPQPGAGGPTSPNTVPSPWAVPRSRNFEQRLAALKTNEFYWSRMRWWDYQFKDSTYLSTLTLGELGALIEFSVHNDMHIRWSAAPRDPDTNELLPLGRPDHEITPKWDNPRYDWLGEFYSSHVNPVFWRLHGWIDDRIEDWYAAHELKHPGEVKRMEKGGVQWFEPSRWVQVEHPWVWPKSLGGYEHGHDHGHDHGHEDPELRAKRIASMEKVMAILFPPEQKLAPSVLTTEPAALVASEQLAFRTSVVGF